MNQKKLQLNTYKVKEYEIIDVKLKNAFTNIINKVAKEFKAGNYDNKLYDELENLVFKIQQIRGEQVKKATDHLKNDKIKDVELVTDKEIENLESKAIKLMDKFSKRYNS